MSLSRILMVLGVLIALAPFLGIPLSILRFFLPFLGLVAIGIGYSLRSSKKESAETISTAETLTI